MLVIFLSASLVYNVHSQESCFNLFIHLTPCLVEISGLNIGLQGPISYSCCSTILDVADNCPRGLQPFWLNKAEENCIITYRKTPPPTPPSNDGDIGTSPPSNGTDKGKSPPPPPPPPQSKQTPPPVPPSNCGNQQNCPDLNRLRPCASQMFDYHNNKTPISSSCCTLILDVREKCSPRQWTDFAIECQNYCLNHP